MPNYFYTAKSFSGETKKGSLFAEDIHSLAQSLKNDGLVLIQGVLEVEKKERSFRFFKIFSGISETEKILIARNLWIMTASGLSLVRIFNILSSQTKNKKLKNIMLDINKRINKGEVFSDAIAKHPDAFSVLFCSMVKIGEESGTLEEVFEILSLHMEKDHDLRSKIRGAMIYPLIIMFTMVVVGSFVITFVMPRFKKFLISLNIDLPIYTRILIGLGDFAQKRWYLMILLPFVLAYGLFLAIKTKIGKLILDTCLIKSPFISQFVKKSNATILIRSLSSLNSSGIPLLRSLEITSGTVGNIYFKRALNGAAEKVKKGEKLSSSLKPYQNIFPLGVIEMMEVGEETGKTTVILKQLSEFYEKEVIKIANNFSAIIEPILIIILGLAVALFAISVIAPMYSSLKVI